MTEPLPENVRQAGADALNELADRMFRGAKTLLKTAARLRPDHSKTYRDALAQLRRYMVFEMPCAEQVLVIEAALLGLTEADSKAIRNGGALKSGKKTKPRVRGVPSIGGSLGSGTAGTATKQCVWQSNVSGRWLGPQTVSEKTSAALNWPRL